MKPDFGQIDHRPALERTRRESENSSKSQAMMMSSKRCRIIIYYLLVIIYFWALVFGQNSIHVIPYLSINAPMVPLKNSCNE